MDGSPPGGHKAHSGEKATKFEFPLRPRLASLVRCLHGPSGRHPSTAANRGPSRLRNWGPSPSAAITRIGRWPTRVSSGAPPRRPPQTRTQRIVDTSSASRSYVRNILRTKMRLPGPTFTTTSAARTARTTVATRIPTRDGSLAPCPKAASKTPRRLNARIVPMPVKATTRIALRPTDRKLQAPLWDRARLFPISPFLLMNRRIGRVHSCAISAAVYGGDVGRLATACPFTTAIHQRVRSRRASPWSAARNNWATNLSTSS